MTEEERMYRNDQQMREWDRLALEEEERARKLRWKSLSHSQKNAIRLLRRKNNLYIKYKPQDIDEDDLPF